MPSWLVISEDSLPAVDLAVKVAIAITAAFIAWQQVKTARDKLKFDLFQRRYSVYESVNEWINDLQSRVVPDEEYAAHIRKMEQAQFLFKDDLNEWLRELRKKAREMNHARRVEEDALNGRAIPHEKIMEASKTYSELTMEFDKALDRTGPMFMRYLDFRRNL